APDPAFARVGIVQQVDFADALAKVVERGGRPFDQRAAEERRLDAARRAIEQADAKRQFHAGNRFRDGWLRQRKVGGRLSHAAVLGDRREDAEVAKPESSQRALSREDLLAHSLRLSVNARIELLEYTLLR